MRTADHVLLRRATIARCREVTANCRSTQTGRLLGTGPAERLASQQRDHPSWQRARDIDRRVSCIASGLSQITEIRSSIKSDPAGPTPLTPESPEIGGRGGAAPARDDDHCRSIGAACLRVVAGGVHYCATRRGGTCPAICAVHPLWRRAASRTRVNRYLSSRRTTPDDLKSHRLQASFVS